MNWTKDGEYYLYVGGSIDYSWDEVSVQQVKKFYDAGVDLVDIAEEVERTPIEVALLINDMVLRGMASGERPLILGEKVK